MISLCLLGVGDITIMRYLYGYNTLAWLGFLSGLFVSDACGLCMCIKLEHGGSLSLGLKGLRTLSVRHWPYYLVL